MYFPRTLPATAFYLDYNLNVFEIEIDQHRNAKRKGGTRTFYASAGQMFTSRKRALAAAETAIRKMERSIESSRKDLEKKRARVNAQLATA
jgi:hypothetical protein